jgi:hypothetical protein
MELQAFVVRDEGEQTCCRITLTCELASARSQLLFGEAKICATTARSVQRVCCNIERSPPMGGESVEAHRRLDRARNHTLSLRLIAPRGIGVCPQSAADNYDSPKRQ